MFGMVSVEECLGCYNIPQVPVLNYLKDFKFVAMKGMTASFSKEALAGLLPVHFPGDHQGVYTHLSAENAWSPREKQKQSSCLNHS